jgi:hypothetical protein
MNGPAPQHHRDDEPGPAGHDHGRAWRPAPQVVAAPFVGAFLGAVAVLWLLHQLHTIFGAVVIFVYAWIAAALASRSAPLRRGLFATATAAVVTLAIAAGPARLVDWLIAG